MPSLRGAVRTHAKLNWDLRVLGRRADGFHELRSWFVPLDWHDDLTAEPAAEGAASLEVSGPRAGGVPADARNLVLRADAAWRAAFPERARRVPALHWRLQKRIPHGAGLGGGSANAAGALALLEGFAGEEGAAPERLAALAATLGSDLPFFLAHRGGAEWRGGRGERLLARAPLVQVPLVVSVPDFGLETARVYAALEAPPWDGRQPEPPAALPAQPGPNDLEAAALRLAPELGEWAEQAFGPLPRAMTGSGSAFFSAAPGAAERVRGALAAKLLTGPALRTRMDS